MPLYIVSAYLYCDACGVLPHINGNQGRQVKLYARADGGWQLPEHWRFVDDLRIVCSDTCQFRLDECAEREKSEKLPAPKDSTLLCLACRRELQRASHLFWILPPGWTDLEPKLPYFLCPACTSDPQIHDDHLKKAAAWLNDYDPI